MRFTVLGSGSTGNAILFSTDKTKILIDAGLSARDLISRLAAVGVSIEEIDAVVISHEHSDHSGGLRVLMRSLKCPVYISGLTEESFYRSRRNNRDGADEGTKRRDALSGKTVKIESGSDFCIGDIDLEAFSVPHDAADNVGFVLKNNGVKIATVMDFGVMTALIKEKMAGCDAIVVESNHSRDMLRTCSVYSWDLKQRIASRTGHISNEDLADWLTNEFDGTARDIVLTHLSQRANEPNLARITAESALMMRPALFRTETRVTISHPKTPTEWIEF